MGNMRKEVPQKEIKMFDCGDFQVAEKDLPAIGQNSEVVLKDRTAKIKAHFQSLGLPLWEVSEKIASRTNCVLGHA